MNDNLIIIGDFNLVMNPDIDRRGSMFNNVKAHGVLMEIMEELLLVDVWRLHNPDTRLFSWMRAKPRLVASRLDFALVSQGLANIIQQTMYLPGIRTDHLGFYMYIEFIPNERGKGYWKFNSSHLQIPEFVHSMNDLIDAKLKQAVNMNPIDKWVYLRQGIIKQAKDFAIARSKMRNVIISQLSEKILEMQYEMSVCSDSDKADAMADLIVRTQVDLDDVLLEKTKSAIFRTKARWRGKKIQGTFLIWRKQGTRQKHVTS